MRVLGNLWLAIVCTAFCVFAGAGRATATDVPAKPLDDGREHLGVASCGGTTCHSRQAPTGAKIRQNEIITWQDQSSVTGAHARAYRVLMTPQSQAIARHLGIGPAEEAAGCLSCHAHNIPETQQGLQFNLAEGVTCEACHGGAGDWLSTHYATGATHAQNVENGLYPVSDITARASLCLDCHFGSDRPDQFVTHRIMGAGHPRISFELDLFTALQQHHDEDTDYQTRKDVAGGIKTWAIGQAMAMERSAALLAEDDIAQDGLFPELYFFDCHACHKPISNDPKAFASWRPNPARPLGPGVPVYNDANLIMLKAAVAEIAPSKSGALQKINAQLHAGTRVGRWSTKQGAEGLMAYGAEMRSVFEGATFDKETSLGILNRILNSTVSREYTNYAAGEQAVIAVDTFLNAMVAQDFISEAAANAIDPALDRAYGAVESPNQYDPGALRASLNQIAARVRAL